MPWAAQCGMFPSMKWTFSRKKRARADAEILFDEGRRCHRLTIRDGDTVSRYSVDLHVCPNPCCHCRTVELRCVAEADDGAEAEQRRRVVALDCREHRATKPGREEPGHDAGLSEVVAEGLNDEGWALLVSHLYGAKREQMESMDLDTLDVQFPPQIMDGDGSMTGYAEIFPFADWFPFSTDNDAWVVDDQYCVSPKCKCHDVVLTFFPSLPNQAAEEAFVEQGEMPAIHYDYRNGSFKVLMEPSIPSPPFSKLVAALKRAHPELATTLKERHGQLRYLFGRVKRERHAETQAERGSGEKVGRNDPCPCGSGRKYKRCCGR